MPTIGGMNVYIDRTSARGTIARPHIILVTRQVPGRQEPDNIINCFGHRTSARPHNNMFWWPDWPGTCLSGQLPEGQMPGMAFVWPDKCQEDKCHSRQVPDRQMPDLALFLLALVQGETCLLTTCAMFQLKQTQSSGEGGGRGGLKSCLWVRAGWIGYRMEHYTLLKSYLSTLHTVNDLPNMMKVLPRS